MGWRRALWAGGLLFLASLSAPAGAFHGVPFGSRGTASLIDGVELEAEFEWPAGIGDSSAYVRLRDAPTGLVVASVFFPVRWEVDGLRYEVEGDCTIEIWHERFVSNTPGILDLEGERRGRFCDGGAHGEFTGTYLGVFHLQTCFDHPQGCDRRPDELPHAYVGVGPVLFGAHHLHTPAWSVPASIAVQDEQAPVIGFSFCSQRPSEIDNLSEPYCVARCGRIELPSWYPYYARTVEIWIDGGRRAGLVDGDACGHTTAGTRGLVTHT